MRAILATAAVAMLAGCTQREATCQPKDGAVTIAISSLPNTLDWNESHESSFQNYPALLAMMQGLTTLAADGSVQPGLAASWDVRVEGGKQLYAFHLRPDAVWSDGTTKVTATDFVTGWRRALLGHEPADLLDLDGAREVVTARSQGAPTEALLAKVGVKALDDATLEVTLTSPRTYFLSRLATVYTFFPAPTAALQGKDARALKRYFDEPDGTHPLVTGEYVPLKWDRVGQKIDLQRNPHFRGPVHPRAVQRLTLLQAALAPVLYAQCRVDFLFQDDPSAVLNPSTGLGASGSDIARSPLMSIYWLGFNTTKVPLPLRRAIAQSLDREKLIDGLLPHARLATSFLPEPMPGATTERLAPSFDVEAARKAIAEAGDPGELTLLVRTGTFIPELGIADAIRRQLEAVGLKVRIVTTTNFTNDIKSKDGVLRHHLFLRRTGSDYAHPQTLLTPLQASGNHYTDWQKLEGGAAQARFQALLDEGAAQTDPEQMHATFAKAQRIVLDEQVVLVPLYFPDRYFLKRPWLEGLGVDAFNFLTYRGAHFQ
jgi:ABC-type oligopeptide transport system substrate-binding subunit